MGKELEGFDEGPKAKIHIDSLEATLKKIPNWKIPCYTWILVQKIHLHL